MIYVASSFEEMEVKEEEEESIVGEVKTEPL